MPLLDFQGNELRPSLSPPKHNFYQSDKMKRMAAEFNYDPNSVPEDTKWHYFGTGWQMKYYEFIIFYRQWKRLLSATDLLDFKPFRSTKGIAKLEKFVTEALNSGHLPSKVTAAPRPWCVAALKSLTRLMKAPDIPRIKKSSSTTPRPLKPKLSLRPQNTGNASTPPPKNKTQIPEFSTPATSMSDDTVCCAVPAQTTSNCELQPKRSTGGLDTSISMPTTKLSQNPGPATLTRLLISNTAAPDNDTDSRIVPNAKLGFQYAIDVSLHVENLCNSSDSLCSTKDFPSHSNTDISRFSHEDWVTWCDIIHEDCGWTKTQQPELDIKFNGIIISNSRKWRTIIEDQMSEAKWVSENRVKMYFTLEKSGKQLPKTPPMFSKLCDSC